MTGRLRALLVEDSADDAALALVELERAFGAVESLRVEDADGFGAALAREWDVIICDHHLPRFSSTAALELLRARQLDVPLIIVSGSIGEDTAVAAMKRGAADYLLKDSLKRLAPAVEREVREAGQRRERRRVEQALREEQRRRLRIIETSQEGIWTVDESGVTDFVNARMGELLGFRPDELLGHPLVDYLHPDELIALDTAPENPLESGRVMDARFQQKDGSTLWARLTSSPIVEDGKQVGALFMISDVGAEKKMMAQLLVSDRMVSVGTLAAGVAHEINNPLAVVVGNIELIAGDLARLDLAGQRDVGDELRQCLDDARDAAERMRLIVRDLKLFSRPDEERLGPVDVRAVMESSLRMAWNEIRHRARLVKDYGTTPAVLANEARLGQVFLNLAVNAAQAIPEGRAEDHSIRVVTRVDGAGRVCVEVKDSGLGIPPEILPRLFDPFFTTKPIGLGTGLGLSICHRIVTGFGGEITVESEPGRGALFRVTLPPAPERTGEHAAAGAAATPAPARRARLLVVDDEPLILRAVERALVRECEVVAVPRARAALERCAAGERFDLILCDLMMPEITGMELHAELEAIAPEQAARMIFMTGGAFTPRARAFLEQVPNQRLEKPFAPSELRALLQRVLAADGVRSR